jgi:hypothetical protein
MIESVGPLNFRLQRLDEDYQKSQYDDDRTFIYYEGVPVA